MAMANKQRSRGCTASSEADLVLATTRASVASMTTRATALLAPEEFTARMAATTQDHHPKRAEQKNAAHS